MPDRQVHACSLEGRTVVVFERSITAPNPALYGIPTTSVVETFYQCDAPWWPTVRIRARRGMEALLYSFGRRPGMALDLPEFTRAFRVDADDEDFAIALLSPEMQAFLLTKQSVDWRTGYGELKLSYRGRFRKNRLERSLQRLREFWSLVPEELQDWPEPDATA